MFVLNDTQRFGYDFGEESSAGLFRRDTREANWRQQL